MQDIVKNIGFLVCLIMPFILQSQVEKVYQTFKDTRVINTNSTEVIGKGKLDFRIGHRFGDIGGDRGGWPSFYGLENAADVLIGFEYGLSDNVMIGINRTKGAGLLKQNINGIFKAKLMSQDKNGRNPISAAFYGMMTGSTMEKSESEGVLNYFDKSIHRYSYHGELILARKFGNRFSLQLSGAVTHRNIVPSLDQNTIASIGGAARLQMTKALGILVDSRYLFSSYRTSENGYYLPLGIALEWETGGGHVFQMNFTNTEGMADTDYIPYSQSSWVDGGFRLGFTISRLFAL